MHLSHEHLEPNDGIDDDDKQDQERDLDQGNESHHDGVEDHLQAGNTGHQSQGSQHSECSQGLGIKTLQLHGWQEYVEKSDHDNGKI